MQTDTIIQQAGDEIATINLCCRDAFRDGRHERFADIIGHAERLVELLPEDDQPGATEIDQHVTADPSVPQELDQIWRKIMDRLDQRRRDGVIEEETYQTHYKPALKALKEARRYWWGAAGKFIA